MKKAISLISILLCICMLMVGCGKEPQTGPNSSDVGGVGGLIPDASGVSDVISNDGLGGEVSGSDPIDPDVQGGATTTAPVGGTVNTTRDTGKTYKTYPIDQWPMPTRELASKEVTLFSWGQLDTKLEFNREYRFAEQVFGFKWTSVPSDTEHYWDNLAKLVAADKSPDLVVLPNWDFYPRPVTKNLIQPLEGIIDFNDTLWDNVRDGLNNLKWKDKIYFPIDNTYINSLFFYNEKMFRDFGIDKTPKDYFLEGKWTWDVFVQLANQFVTFNADNSIKTAGYAQGPDAMHVTTGVKIVEYSPTTGYKLNLKDKKLAQYFNMLHDLGQGGTKAWLWPDYWYQAYDKGQVAMMTSECSNYTSTSDMSDETRKNTTVVPMPRMDEKSDYYFQVHYRLNHCVPLGAKNTDAAGLFIEFYHWCRMGQQKLDILPQETNASMKKFKWKNEPTQTLSNAQVDWLKKMLTLHDYKDIDMLWQSWQGGYTRIHGEYDVYCGESWSSAVAKNYPKVNATIKMNFR